MPNNSNARQKKQSKKKKTDPLPLHKENKASKEDEISKDKASMDSRSLPFLFQERMKSAWIEALLLFLLQDRPEVAADIMDPKHLENVLLLRHFHSLTQEEKMDMREKIQDANPGASKGELKIIHREVMLKAALEAQKSKSQDAKESSLSSPLAGMDNEK